MSNESTPLVVVFPRGQLSPIDKERLTKNGIIAVEADNPKDVCQLHLTQPLTTGLLTGDGIVRAALEAMSACASENSAGSITGRGRVKSLFVELLNKAIKDSK